jgi:hypothetical protein
MATEQEMILGTLAQVDPPGSEDEQAKLTDTGGTAEVKGEEKARVYPPGQEPGGYATL